MESIDEILDLDELQENKTDETLKEFMIRDEEAARLLNSKIDELNSEEEKLSKKEEEIKGLEESNREKINSNASPEELIDIAGKLKKAEEELSQITENIKKLELEREELVETKNNIEKTKLEYIKNLNSTNSNYEQQLSKISEAIEVCDNPALKQVLEDVKNQKEKDLKSLQEKRNSELKVVLNDVEDETTSQKEQLEISKEIPIIENTVSEDNSTVQELNSYSDDKIANLDEVKEDTEKSDDMINIDAILSNIEARSELTNKIDNSSVTPSLNVINTDDMVLPDVNISDLNNEDKIKIILEKNVPDILLKEIFSSSSIMPVLYDYLDNKGGSLI